MHLSRFVTKVSKSRLSSPPLLATSFILKATSTSVSPLYKSPQGYQYSFLQVSVQRVTRWPLIILNTLILLQARGHLLSPLNYQFRPCNLKKFEVEFFFFFMCWKKCTMRKVMRREVAIFIFIFPQNPCSKQVSSFFSHNWSCLFVPGTSTETAYYQYY